MLLCAGKDATGDFEDAGHNSSTRAMLDEYYVGDFESIFYILIYCFNAIQKIAIKVVPEPSVYSFINGNFKGAVTLHLNTSLDHIN